MFSNLLKTFNSTLKNALTLKILALARLARLAKSASSTLWEMVIATLRSAKIFSWLSEVLKSRKTNKNPIKHPPQRPIKHTPKSYAQLRGKMSADQIWIAAQTMFAWSLLLEKLSTAILKYAKSKRKIRILFSSLILFSAMAMALGLVKHSQLMIPASSDSYVA